MWKCTPLIPALRSQRQVDLGVQSQPGLLQSKFQGSKGYTEKPCLKKIRTNKNPKLPKDYVSTIDQILCKQPINDTLRTKYLSLAR